MDLYLYHGLRLERGEVDAVWVLKQGEVWEGILR